MRTVNLFMLVVLFCLVSCSQGKVASGIKGLFHRNPKQASLDSHVAAQLSRKHPFGAHLLRRTASEPTKGEPKVKKGFPEIAIDTKDYSSEGASEDRESEDRDLSASSQPPQLHQRNGDAKDTAAPATPRQGNNGHHSTNGAFNPDEGKGKGSPHFLRYPMSEPLKRVNRLRCHDPLNEKPGVFARMALNSSGRMGVSSNCINCVISSKESPEMERKFKDEEKWGERTKAWTEMPERAFRCPTPFRQVQPEPMPKPQALVAAQPDKSLAQSKPTVEALPLFQPQAFF